MNQQYVDLADYTSGSTEPWIVEILVSLVRGIRATSVLELGAFEGKTTGWLASATAGTVTAVEGDPQRLSLASGSLQDRTNVRWVCQDTIAYLSSLPADPTWDFVFVDDDHGYAHVAEELDLLLPRMKRGGLIAMHDVIGSFGLSRLVHRHGGIVLHTPLLHAAGGLGLISVHDPNLKSVSGAYVIVSDASVG